MLRKRSKHGVALAAFRRTRERSIHNFPECASPPPSRVVVTGGTGCIGTAMLRHLQAEGVEHLTSISRRLPAPERRIRHVDYRTADIRDISRMQTTLQLKNPELVIHLAGQRQPALAERRVAETLSSNIFGTMSVLAAAGEAGVPRVVTASTGKALRFFASEVYTASKKVAEYLVAQGPARSGHLLRHRPLHPRRRQFPRVPADSSLGQRRRANPSPRTRHRVLRPVGLRGRAAPHGVLDTADGCSNDCGYYRHRLATRPA